MHETPRTTEHKWAYRQRIKLSVDGTCSDRHLCAHDDETVLLARRCNVVNVIPNLLCRQPMRTEWSSVFAPQISEEGGRYQRRCEGSGR